MFVVSWKNKTKQNKNKNKNRHWPASNALLRMTHLLQSFLSRFCINISVIRVMYTPNRPTKLTRTLEITRLLHCCCIKLIVLFKLWLCLLIILLYRDKDFTFGPLNSHRYIENIVISKIVISGRCPIHFTVILPGHIIFNNYSTRARWIWNDR